MSNWPSETSSTPILPSYTSNTPFETQRHERQDISQHIRQQNADDKREVLDLGESSGVKTRKTRSKVWENFDRYQDENGTVRARCKGCGKDFDGSSKLGTTHLGNHFTSCQRKRNGGGGRDNLAGNLSDTIAIKEKSVMDQPLNHLDAARMIIKQGDASRIDPTNKGYIIELYKKEKEKLRNYFKKLSCRLCLTVHEVEPVIDDVGLFYSKVWFIDDNWKLKNKIIGLKVFSDNQTIVDDIKEMLLEWGIEKNLSFVVADFRDDDNLYEIIRFIERDDWFSNQGSLLLNNKLIFKDFGICDIGTTGNTYFTLLCSHVKRLVEASDSAWDKIIQDFDSACNEILGFMEEAKDEWSEYNLVLAVAAVLDPRFRMNIVKKWYEILGGKWKGLLGDEWEAEFKNFEDYFTEIYHQYARDINNFKSCNSGSEETNSSISYKMLSPLREPYEPKYAQLQKSELQLYLEDVRFPSLQDFDVLKWWGDHSQHFPTLATMARDFLSFQLSSAGVFIDSFDNVDVSERLAIAEAYTCTKSWLAT